MTHSKTDQLTLIPILAQYEIFNGLNLKEKASFVSLSKSYHSIFQNELRVLKLLQLVVQGQRDSAEQLLMKHPELISIPGDVTDCSGRTFEKITSFEYAFWAKDIFTCRMLLKHMNEEIRENMLNRCKKIELNGLSFKQDDQIFFNSRHYDFEPLLVALRYCLEVKDIVNSGGDAAEKNLAQEALMTAQMNVPVHVAQEYFRTDRSFKPLPSFEEDILPDIHFKKHLSEWYLSGFPNPKSRTTRTIEAASLGFVLGGTVSLCIGENDLGTYYFLLIPVILTAITGLLGFCGVDFGETSHRFTGFTRGGHVEPELLLYDFQALQLDLNAMIHLDQVRTKELAHLLENTNPIAPKFSH